MRRLGIGLFAVFSALPPSSALAASCYSHNGYWYCDPGCSITRTWWDARGQEWINYSCMPSPFGTHSQDPVFVLAIVSLAVLIFIAAVAENSQASPTSADSVDPDTAATHDIAAQLEAAARAADEHITKILEKSRKDGDSNG